MALNFPKDTLAYHRARPLTTHRDMSDVPCSAVCQRIRAFMQIDTEKDTVPEKEALWFYAMNHLTALVSAGKAPLEPLTDIENSIMDTYHKMLAPKSVRAFYYLLLICVRESRYLHNKSNYSQQVTKQFGPEAAKLMNSLGQHGSIQTAEYFLKNPPKCGIGQIVRSIQWIFYNGKFSGGYGGPAWGKVCDCLVEFVTGKFSAEMMMDTVWTLQHNNGPIFNKSMMYQSTGSQIQTLLDIQRSGQIPHALLEGMFHSYVDQDLLNFVQLARSVWENDIGLFVDWYQVEALGSVGKYPSQKKAQLQKFGTPEQLENIAKMEAEAEKKAKQAAEAKAAAKKAAEEQEKKGYFYPMPDVKVKVIDRKAA